MAVTYAVNGTTIEAGVQAFWLPIVTGANADGTQKLSTNWYRHSWQCEVMEAAEWNTLTALRGTSLTTLQTSDESTPNSSTTYATARLLTTVGQHMGRRILNATITFLVDTSS